MKDYLTILTTVPDREGRQRLAVKSLWREGEEWRSQKSDSAALWTFRREPVEGTFGHADAIWRLVGSHSVVVMGEALPVALDGEPHRRLRQRRRDEPATIGRCARRYVLFDIDGLPCPEGVPPTSEEAACHAVRTVLPELWGVTFWFQFTASAGTTKPGAINVRIAVWLSRPMSEPERQAQWGGRDYLDPSVFDCNQLIYCGPPVFDGVPDPIGRRAGTHLAEHPEWGVPPEVAAAEAAAGGSADTEAAALVAEMADPEVTLARDGGSRTLTLCRVGRRICELVKLHGASDAHVAALRDAALARFEDGRDETREQWAAEVEASIQDNILGRTPPDDARPPRAEGTGRSEDALALAFTERHGGELRYVALWAGGWSGPGRTGATTARSTCSTSRAPCAARSGSAAPARWPLSSGWRGPTGGTPRRPTSGTPTPGCSTSGAGRWTCAAAPCGRPLLATTSRRWRVPGCRGASARGGSPSLVR